MNAFNVMIAAHALLLALAVAKLIKRTKINPK